MGKKDKKFNKFDDEEQEEKMVREETVEEEEEEKPKKSKKEKKEKRKEKKREEEEEEEQSEKSKKKKRSNNEEDSDSELNAKKKKQKNNLEEEEKPKKKKKEKVQEEEEEEEEKPKKKKKEKVQSEEEEEEEEKPKKKKEKKHYTDINATETKSGGSYTLPSYRKNFYKEHPKLAKATAEEIQSYWSSNNVTVSDSHGTFFRPVRTFDEIGLEDPEGKYSKLYKEATKKFEKPSPIQASTWPILLSGRDAIGIAETGSGKTLAFLLPAFVHILDKMADKNVPKSGHMPLVLVLSPTRELAMQIQDVAAAVGSKFGINSVCLYGGVSKYDQKKIIQQGVQIVVATPGRLQDLMEDRSIVLERVSFLVLDEADRMLDMGFEKEVRKIVSTVPNNRQTLMFSATWPTLIQKLASEYLIDPVKVTIGSEDLNANKRVTQIVEVLEDDRKKTPRLLELLKDYHKSKKNRILIFILYKKEASWVENALYKAGYKATSIHSDKTQMARTQALEAFKSGDTPLLIATDVAARGLDIPDVEYVINYTFPLTIEDYIHRIGRTGRGGKFGVAHTFFNANDKAHSGELCNVLREAGMDVPAELMKFGTHIKKKEHAFFGNHFKSLDSNGAPPKKASKITFDD